MSDSVTATGRPSISEPQPAGEQLGQRGAVSAAPSSRRAAPVASASPSSCAASRSWTVERAGDAPAVDAQVEEAEGRRMRGGDRGPADSAVTSTSRRRRREAQRTAQPAQGSRADSHATSSRGRHRPLRAVDRGDADADGRTRVGLEPAAQRTRDVHAHRLERRGAGRRRGLGDDAVRSRASRSRYRRGVELQHRRPVLRHRDVPDDQHQPIGRAPAVGRPTVKAPAPHVDAGPAGRRRSRARRPRRTTPRSAHASFVSRPHDQYTSRARTGSGRSPRFVSLATAKSSMRPSRLSSSEPAGDRQDDVGQGADGMLVLASLSTTETAPRKAGLSPPRLASASRASA